MLSNPIVARPWNAAGKRAKAAENLKRFCEQFGMKPADHRYAYWRSLGYDPKVTY